MLLCGATILSGATSTTDSHLLRNTHTGEFAGREGMTLGPWFPDVFFLAINLDHHDGLVCCKKTSCKEDCKMLKERAHSKRSEQIEVYLSA